MAESSSSQSPKKDKGKQPDYGPRPLTSRELLAFLEPGRSTRQTDQAFNDDLSDVEEGGVGIGDHGEGQAGSSAGAAQLAGRVNEHAGSSASVAEQAGGVNEQAGSSAVEQAGGVNEQTLTIQSNAADGQDGSARDAVADHRVDPPTEPVSTGSGRGTETGNGTGARTDSLSKIFPFLMKITGLKMITSFIGNPSRQRYPFLGRWSRKSQPSNNIEKECTACLGEYPAQDLLHAICGHSYCVTCVEKLFSDAIKNETRFPPHCCRIHLNIESAIKFLPVDLIAKFRLIEIERADKNRTYCSNPRCSRYLFPEVKGVCATCGRDTCVACKQKAHDGLCKSDDNGWLKKMAEQKKWKACFSCGRYVELRAGCNHVSCRCGAEFCYKCGTRWKNCDCSRVSDNIIAERDALMHTLTNAFVSEEQNEEVTPELAEMLEQGVHEHLQFCGRVEWRTRDGIWLCDVCQEIMNESILECPECLIRACQRCRRQRL